MTRRRYAADFIREAVALVQGGRSVGEVADTLGMPHGSLWNWVTKAQTRPSDRPVPPAAPVDPAAYAALQRRVAELERENEFLGKASAFFASKAHRKP
jgi:transposase